MTSTRVAASESLDDHFAGSGEGFLAMFREYCKNPAKERVLGGAEMVEDVRQRLRRCRRLAPARG
jgi:hypothetical protein